MTLNLPLAEEFASCRNLLVAGMGGGFDVFCGLPLFFELRRRGQNVHLANLSFSQTLLLKDGLRLSENLVGVTGASRSVVPYFPELHLAHWFRETQGEDVPVWCFQTEGVLPLLAAYRALTAHLEIDGILLVDGGVDGLLRGDEAQIGTILEDSCSLAAVSEMAEIPFRKMVCLGLGAEQDILHAQIFENIAALTEAGAFSGVCALTKTMEVYQLYEQAVSYAHGKRGQDESVINASVVSAVQGHYGDFHATEKTKGSRLWISPLMPLYWFFDAPAVAARNLFLPDLKRTTTRREVMTTIASYRARLPLRPPGRVPLP